MNKKKFAKILEVGIIISIFITFVALFLPSLNPTRVSKEIIDKTMSFFTAGISWGRLTKFSARPIRLGWVEKSDFVILYVSSLVSVIGILGSVIGASFLLGNTKYKNLSNKLTIVGNVLLVLGLAGVYQGYRVISNTEFPEKVVPVFPIGIPVFLGLAVITIILSVAMCIVGEKAQKTDQYEMSRPNQLFLMYLPFALLIFVFSYLPLWGWRYAFFDYQPGGTLSKDNFVGFFWFRILFTTQRLEDILQVLRNTLIMSGLGIMTSWMPMLFAVFLAEATSSKFKRFVQTFSTVPNFISWVLVYSLALAIFSTDGFINGFLNNVLKIQSNKNYLLGDTAVWLKMWAWGTWKGLGWSSIIYISAISSIDPVLYEAAEIDGAGRFQKMRYITLPSLMPTFFVLLVLSVANILSNGMEQYLVFSNAHNLDKIQVLDLYVYNLGLNNEGQIPLSTLVGALKSLISITLLFSVNRLSKKIRGESVF